MKGVHSALSQVRPSGAWQANRALVDVSGFRRRIGEEVADHGDVALESELAVFFRLRLRHQLLLDAAFFCEQTSWTIGRRVLDENM